MRDRDPRWLWMPPTVFGVVMLFVAIFVDSGWVRVWDAVMVVLMFLIVAIAKVPRAKR